MTEPVRKGEFTREEVWLALRNHGMHLEGLRYPITPVGMHYLLIHFDIPLIDPATYGLEIGGLVRKPLELTLDQLRARPATTGPLTARPPPPPPPRPPPRPPTSPRPQAAPPPATNPRTPPARARGPPAPPRGRAGGAGGARARPRLSRRPISAPWHEEAVGCAEW